MLQAIKVWFIGYFITAAVVVPVLLFVPRPKPKPPTQIVIDFSAIQAMFTNVVLQGTKTNLSIRLPDKHIEIKF